MAKKEVEYRIPPEAATGIYGWALVMDTLSLIPGVNVATAFTGAFLWPAIWSSHDIDPFSRKVALKVIGTTALEIVPILSWIPTNLWQAVTVIKWSQLEDRNSFIKAAEMGYAHSRTKLGKKALEKAKKSVASSKTAQKVGSWFAGTRLGKEVTAAADDIKKSKTWQAGVKNLQATDIGIKDIRERRKADARFKARTGQRQPIGTRPSSAPVVGAQLLAGAGVISKGERDAFVDMYNAPTDSGEMYGDAVYRGTAATDGKPQRYIDSKTFQETEAAMSGRPANPRRDVDDFGEEKDYDEIQREQERLVGDPSTSPTRREEPDLISGGDPYFKGVTEQQMEDLELKRRSTNADFVSGRAKSKEELAALEKSKMYGATTGATAPVVDGITGGMDDLKDRTIPTEAIRDAQPRPSLWQRGRAIKSDKFANTEKRWIAGNATGVYKPRTPNVDGIRLQTGIRGVQGVIADPYRKQQEVFREQVLAGQDKRFRDLYDDHFREMLDRRIDVVGKQLVGIRDNLDGVDEKDRLGLAELAYEQKRSANEIVGTWNDTLRLNRFEQRALEVQMAEAIREVELRHRGEEPERTSPYTKPNELLDGSIATGDYTERL